MCAYSKKTLSQKYMPDSSPEAARAQFMRWIEGNAELKQKLVEAGYKKYNKTLTPKQVEIISSYFGEP